MRAGAAQGRSVWFMLSPAFTTAVKLTAPVVKIQNLECKNALIVMVHQHLEIFIKKPITSIENAYVAPRPSGVGVVNNDFTVSFQLHSVSVFHVGGSLPVA